MAVGNHGATVLLLQHSISQKSKRKCACMIQLAVKILRRLEVLH